MKSVHSVLLGLLLIFLGYTNPRSRQPYVNHLAREVQTLCCSASGDRDTCEQLRPLTMPLVKGVLYMYTDAPADYFVFTRYRTDLPGHTLHGVGIAGEFIVWRQDATDYNACEILHEAVLGERF